ncbi:hypothetical protein P7K49_031775 [Saguinus oedipus]|uniref:ASCIZ first and second C2H2 zinc finger domain-containing protein n=1 Tax=Saguinus oedipus TaxID=9490 RepID=A0ABQ9U166_SAGOE|nr:hypothetical protein P7K49_031775 [Saguinus oedipus]
MREPWRPRRQRRQGARLWLRVPGPSWRPQEEPPPPPWARGCPRNPDWGSRPPPAGVTQQPAVPAPKARELISHGGASCPGVRTSILCVVRRPAPCTPTSILCAVRGSGKALPSSPTLSLHLAKRHRLQDGIVNSRIRKDLKTVAKFYCCPIEGCPRGSDRPSSQFSLVNSTL